MFTWFRTWMSQAFLTRLHASDPVLRHAATQVAEVRKHLHTLYEEVTLAIQGLDLLDERIDTARQRLLAHQVVRTHEEGEDGAALPPQVFTKDRRQREAMERKA